MLFVNLFRHNSRMRYFTFLFVAFLVLSASFAYAEEQVKPRGYVPFGKEKKLPPITSEQLDESLAIYDECVANKVATTRYDCDCVGMRYLDLRRERGPLALAYDLKIAARHDCPNAPDVAGMMYERCLSWAPRERTDYERFCSCYASNYARRFSKNPSGSLLVQEAQMTASLSECDAGWVTKERLERRDLVEQLKERGLYKLLFPGAIEFNAAKSRAEEKKKRDQQILNPAAP